MAKQKQKAGAPTEGASPRIPDKVAEQLFELRGELRDAEEAEDQAAEMHKEKKKARETTQTELNAFLDEIEKGVGPLFGETPEAGPAGQKA